MERGDLPQGPRDDEFDDTLVDGLKHFQDRHGLAVDGIYGTKALAELNVPLSKRIEQVRLGLERLRWLPRTSTGRRIAVNIADFKAYVFDDDRVTFETRAVVGKLFHETPMFTGRMTYIVINPYWNVPSSIARKELLPKAKADPGYLARNHFEYDGTSIRQRPGPWNSLGRFKFMFPNPHNVYLHDTPARTLFNEADRAFSHGCVRLEKPAELAELLLAEQGWTAQRIRAAVQTGVETVVNLDKPIPVYISYITAFLGADGLLHFRRDVYGRDKRLLDALQQVSQGEWDR
jgi:murein L,D-transpeptidase YcbB/YkuD